VNVGVDFASKFVSVEARIPEGGGVVITIRSPIELDYFIGQLQAARYAIWPMQPTPATRKVYVVDFRLEKVSQIQCVCLSLEDAKAQIESRIRHLHGEGALVWKDWAVVGYDYQISEQTIQGAP
jgi:hypothetical protein